MKVLYSLVGFAIAISAVLVTGFFPKSWFA